MTITLSAGPSVTINPTTFTFVAGQSGYSEIYTVTSVEPGTYTMNVGVTGTDQIQGFIGQVPTVSVQVDARM